MSRTVRFAVAAAVVLVATACVPPSGDTTPPVLSLPDGISVEAVDESGAEISFYGATATDDVDGDVPVTCDPLPGLFPVGETEVTCSATDAAGNVATGAFLVTVAPAAS